MRKTTLGLFTALFLAAVAFTCIALRRFNLTLRSARSQVSRENSLGFTLEPVTPAHGPAFEPVASADTFTAAAVFAGKLYLAGDGGVAIYDSPTSVPQHLRAGIELPPAPIVSLTIAHLRGHPAPELLGLPRNAGLLLFDANAPPRQLLPSSADARDLTAVLALDSGDLLLGTRHAGLLLFDGTRLRFFSPALTHLDITALAGNETGFWIGTRDHGLLHWHSGQLDTLDTAAGLPDNTILSLAESARGVFAGTPLGVAQIVDGRVSRQLGRGLFAQSLAVQGSSLLVATMDQGLETVPLNARPELASAHASSGPAIDSLIATSGGVLALSHGSLLRRSDSGTWQTVITAPEQTLADNNVSALSVGADGRLWIGYFDRGMDVYDPATGRAQHLEDDHLFCINRIAADPIRHTMDVATANGLVLLDPAAAQPRPRQVLTRHDGLAADQVTDIAFSADGTALAGPAGITVLTPSGAQSLSSFHGLANNHVYALAAEPTSEMMVAGTLAGVSVIDHLNVALSFSLRDSSLPRNWITAIARISAPGAPPSWLIGTYGGSVAQMDAEGHITRPDTPAPDVIINPNALLVTPQHVLAGTLGHGLFLYNRSTQHWSQITTGLPSLNVTAFAARSGELYIGTANGVVRLPEQALP